MPSRKRQRHLRQVAERRTRRAASQSDGPGNLLVYLTAEEIFGPGTTMSIADVIGEVRQVSMELTLGWCAHWIAQLDRPDNDRRDVDREFVDTHFAQPVRSRIHQLLTQPRRVLLTSQAFTVIAKLAIEHGHRGGPPPPDADVSPLLRAIIGVPEWLSGDVTSPAPDKSDDDRDGSDGRMALYMVANQLFNNPTDWRTAWAVSHRCLREIPVELEAHPRIVNFATSYAEATGVELDDLVTLCAVLWSRAMSGHPTVEMSYLEPLGWDEPRLEAAIRLISATPGTLRQMLNEDSFELGRWWSTKTFDQFPVVRWDGHLTVLHPSWLVNRSTGVWPLLDVRRCWSEGGDRVGAARVAGSVEHAYEHFALEAIEDVAGDERVYRDDALRRAFGAKGSVADAAVQLGSSWMVVEVTARGFQLGTAAGASQESLERDLDHIVDKARQLDATINNIRSDETALLALRAGQDEAASLTDYEVEPPAGRERASGPRFHPLVVVASRFAGNALTFSMLHRKLEAAGVLQGEDCAALEVFELEDLLALEGACEQHGCDLAEVLADKAAASGGSLLPMKDYLQRRLGHPAGYPDRVQKAWPTWMDTAIEQLDRDEPSGLDRQCTGRA